MGKRSPFALPFLHELKGNSLVGHVRYDAQQLLLRQPDFPNKVGKALPVFIVGAKPPVAAEARVVPRAFAPELARPARCEVQRRSLMVAGLRAVAADGRVGRAVPAAAEDHRLAIAQIGQVVALFVVHHHALAHGTPVVLGEQAMDDLGVGVLDDVGNQLGRYLVGNDETFTILAHFGQHVGKRLHGHRGSLVTRLRAGEQAVRFFNQGEVAKFGLPGMTCADGLVDTTHQQGHEQGLFLAALQLLQLDDDRSVEKLIERQGLTHIQHLTQGAIRQAAQSGNERTTVFLLEFLAQTKGGNKPVQLANHVAHGWPGSRERVERVDAW